MNSADIFELPAELTCTIRMTGREYLTRATIDDRGSVAIYWSYKESMNENHGIYDVDCGSARVVTDNLSPTSKSIKFIPRHHMQHRKVAKRTYWTPNRLDRPPMFN